MKTGVILLLLGCLSFQRAGGVEEVTGRETNLVSSGEGMISHRFQKHSWIAPNGVRLALINSGANSGAIQIFSSTDGVAWILEEKIDDSDKQSHPDGLLDGSRLYVAYHTRADALRVAIFEADASFRNWHQVGSPTVLRMRRTKFERPSLALDGEGRLWVSATAVLRNGDKALQIFVCDRPGEPLKFVREIGLVNSNGQRSGRLLKTPDGILFVFSDDAWRDRRIYSLNFTFRRDAEPISAPWAPLVQILQHDNEDDENGAHFSCAVDSQGATHIVTRSRPSMYYLRIAHYALEPGMPRDLGVANPDKYPQASVSQDDSVHLACPAASGAGTSVDVLSSFDGGETFDKTHSLIYNSALGAPRVEAPANFGSLLPVLLLTEPTTGSKRLVSFDVEFDGP